MNKEMTALVAQAIDGMETTIVLIKAYNKCLDRSDPDDPDNDSNMEELKKWLRTLRGEVTLLAKHCDVED